MTRYAYSILQKMGFQSLLTTLGIIAALFIILILLKITGCCWTLRNRCTRGPEGAEGNDTGAGSNYPWPIGMVGDAIYCIMCQVPCECFCRRCNTVNV